MEYTGVNDSDETYETVYWRQKPPVLIILVLMKILASFLLPLKGQKSPVSIQGIIFLIEKKL